MLGTPKRLPPPFFFPRHYALLSSSLPLQSLHEATMVVVVMMTVAVVTPKRIPRASLQQVHQSCRQYCIFARCTKWRCFVSTPVHLDRRILISASDLRRGVFLIGTLFFFLFLL